MEAPEKVVQLPNQSPPDDLKMMPSASPIPAKPLNSWGGAPDGLLATSAVTAGLGIHLELKEELSVSGSGFTTCWRHRDDTSIRSQLKN